jgi:hypothetical protein
MSMKELIEAAEAKMLTEGYTHYWEHKGFDDKAWDKLKTEAKKIFQKAIKDGVELAGPHGDGKPRITDFEIAFNGKRPDDYETFWLSKGSQDFEFTKTAHRPYDPVVVSILAAAKKLNKTFKPSSDGGASAIKRIY